MQRSQVARKDGHRRTRAELVEMRARLNARTEELLAEGYAADRAIAVAKAEENARRDREILEQEVAEVVAEKLMERDVDGVEVSEEEVARLDGVEVVDEETGEVMGDGSDDEPDPSERTEVQEIAGKILADDVETDGRKKIPTLQMTWDDIDASGAGVREWDKMADENEAWYQAFAVYLHLPPLERGVGAAYRSWNTLVGRTRKAKKNVPTAWFRAAQKYAWEVRAAEYDKTRTARFVGKMEMAEEEVEDELTDALMSTLRKCVQRIKSGRLEEIPMGSVIREIPNLVEQIRKQMGLGEKTSLDAIMQALPPQFRQQVLLAVNIGTVTIDGKGVERAFGANNRIQSRPLADLTLPDRSLERELRELEEIEGELKDVLQEGA